MGTLTHYPPATIGQQYLLPDPKELFCTPSAAWEAHILSLPESSISISIPFSSPKPARNCGGSEILPNFQANKVACHRLMGAGRRHETPESETENFIPWLQQARRLPFHMGFPCFPRPQLWAASWVLCIQGVCITAV